MASRGRRRKEKAPPKQADALEDRIVDTALQLADEIGWRHVTLREVSARLELSMAAVQSRYRDLDAVADAWFARAWQAMLAEPPETFRGLSAEARLHFLLMSWFDALATHRRVSCQMLREKLYPSHPHHWVPLIFNLSRTIQLLRDASLLVADGRQRQFEELGLSAIFLATLRVWCRDETTGQERTRSYLSRRLAVADSVMTGLWRRRQRSSPGL
jgi:AcrR family transcriptional regulator